MTHRLTWIAAAAAACAALSAPAAVAKEKKSGEEKLAELLEGRQAGEPKTCISDFGPARHLKVIDGTADRSYGIHVAKLAGLPSPTVNRANEILEKLEKGDEASSLSLLANDLPLFQVQNPGSGT